MEACALRSFEKRLAVFEAVVESAKPDPKINFTRTTTRFDGGALEQIVILAFMISTHSEGIAGMPFDEWFPYFIQQLGCYTSDQL